jgi:protein-arginine kinase activator protein McsA
MKAKPYRCRQCGRFRRSDDVMHFICSRCYSRVSRRVVELRRSKGGAA